MISPSFSTALFLGLCLIPQTLHATCAAPPHKPIIFSEKDVYKGMPFAKGELIRLRVSYLKIHAGYLEFKVLPPTKVDKQWYMSFNTLVQTGEWYNGIFKARDEGSGLATPDFAPFEFRLTQDNNPLIGRRYVEDKMIRFDSQTCNATEEYRDKDLKVTKSAKFPLDNDALDILAAFYKLRTVDFIRNAEARIKVYTSEKNWWLTATREDFVRLTTPHGKYDAVRLKLETFIGKELQQKGNVKIWIAINHPQRPVLKIEAEIKIGSFIATLVDFEPGT